MDLKDKRVLVTGSEGFIGSHLVEALLEQKCKVKAFVYYNAFNHWGWLDSFSRDKMKDIEIFTGDIRDSNGVRAAMKEVDIVFHLAALIGIPFSYHSPDSYIDTNVKGTLNVLQAARELKTERILVTSTSEIYGTASYTPIDEKHPNCGQSPYSATKIAADKIAESFFRSFNLPITIVRPFNTYGPRQSARAIIPTIITQLLSGQKEIKLGALYPTRDFVFVKDTVRAFVEIAGSDKTIGEEINIATQIEVSIEELAKKIVNMLNSEAVVTEDKLRLRPDRSEVKRLLGSNEKIRRLTNWKPEYTLDIGLKETIEWFKKIEPTMSYKADIYNV